MFEQQQNTGKSASLAEKYANVRGQVATAVKEQISQNTHWMPSVLLVNS